MIHYAKYYFTTVLTPFFVLGIFAGGLGLWSGFFLLTALMVLGDALLGDDTEEPDFKHPWILEIPLQLALPNLALLLLALAWSMGSGTDDFLHLGALANHLLPWDVFAAREHNSLFDYLGGAIACGLMVAGYGTNVAHELCHRTRAPFSNLVSRHLLAMSCNPDFTIEHVLGHHANVCTPEDPATARRGENVYAFAVRSTIMGHISAWHLELKRLQRKKQSPWGWHNQMLTGYTLTLLWPAIFYAAAGWPGVALFLATALMAKFVLEVVNYMEHYGMTRAPGTRVRPEHSWNTNRKMSGLVLFSLTRHSAHHEKGALPYWKLSAYPDAPEMPQGYLTTIFLCLIPPLWKRVIDPKLAEWDRLYAQG